MSIIELKDVNYNYKVAEQLYPALSNISLCVDKGEFLTVIGKNGSGKSTLAKLLNGLFLPSSGSVKINGFLTSDEKNIFEVRKSAGMVFQNPDNQMVATIVEDDVAFGPENIGIETTEIVDRVEWALSTVGMLESAKRPASKLSGGQKQRVAIAGILALKPQILILDEATSMLDPQGRAEVLEVVKKLNDSGITIVLITHNMDEVVFSNRTVVLNGGKIVFDGTPKELFSNSELVEKASLSLPPIPMLCKILNEQGFKIKRDSLHLDEFTEELCSLLK